MSYAELTERNASTRSVGGVIKSNIRWADSSSTPLAVFCLAFSWKSFVSSKLFSNNKLCFGKELDELVKLIPKSKNSTQSVDNTLEYMEKLFMNMNMRMG